MLANLRYGGVKWLFNVIFLQGMIKTESPCKSLHPNLCWDFTGVSHSSQSIWRIGGKTWLFFGHPVWLLVFWAIFQLHGFEIITPNIQAINYCLSTGNLNWLAGFLQKIVAFQGGQPILMTNHAVKKPMAVFPITNSVLMIKFTNYWHTNPGKPTTGIKSHGEGKMSHGYE